MVTVKITGKPQSEIDTESRFLQKEFKGIAFLIGPGETHIAVNDPVEIARMDEFNRQKIEAAATPVHSGNSNVNTNVNTSTGSSNASGGQGGTVSKCENSSSLTKSADSISQSEQVVENNTVYKQVRQAPPVSVINSGECQGSSRRGFASPKCEPN